jgi:hypothetical protein
MIQAVDSQHYPMGVSGLYTSKRRADERTRTADLLMMPATRHSARSIVTLKSSLWRLIASISLSNWPMRTMPLKNGASLS